MNNMKKLHEKIYDKVTLPKVEVPKVGLHDVFITTIARAMAVPVEDAKIIFNIQ